MDDNGQLYCFLGTYQINEKLQVGDKGKKVRIRYEGEERSVVRSGNPMRIFRVFVSSEVVNGAAERGGT